VTASTARVEFEVVYRGRLRGGATAVRERVKATAGAVEVEHAVEGDIDGVRQMYPFLVNDGVQESAVFASGNAVEIRRGNGRLRYEGLDTGLTIQRLGTNEPCRNGFLSAAYAESSARRIRCRVGVGLNRR
jgi:hypothetical protein